MLTYQYYMPKRIDLTSNWDKQENLIFIIITHFQKTRITCQYIYWKKKTYTLFIILQNVSGKSGGKYK